MAIPDKGKARADDHGASNSEGQQASHNAADGRQNKQRGQSGRFPGRGRRRDRGGRGGAAAATTAAPQMPGLNKLKASLRQTRRLLERDDVDAEKRQEAERREIALKEDIAVQEEQNKLATIALKNKKRMFFDVSKATRKINTALRSRTQGKQEDGVDQDAGSANIDEDLYRHRLVLNYATHWPPAEYYTRFFMTDPEFDTETMTHPSNQKNAGDKKNAEVNVSDDDEDDEDTNENAVGPSSTGAEGTTADGSGNAATASSTNNTMSAKKKARVLRMIEVARTHRAWVEQAMASGEISAEPEKDVAQTEGRGVAPAGRKRRRKDALGEEGSEGTAEKAEGRHAQKRRLRREQMQPRKAAGTGAGTDAAGQSQAPPPKKRKSSKNKKIKTEAEAAAVPKQQPDNGLAGDDFFDV